MLENINWNWSSIGVAAIFVLSAMIAAGAQIQARDAVAYSKIDEEGAGCINSFIGVFKWLSLLMAAISLSTMLLGLPFNKTSWWLAIGWLIFIMVRGNDIVKGTSR